MQIILIRHGLMEDNKLSEEYKPLSQKGEEQVKLLGIKLNNIILKPRIIFASSYECSRKTAYILKDKLGLGGEPVFLENLKPYKKGITFVDQLSEEIKKKGKNLEDKEVVAFVGHYPYLWDLMCSLTTDQIHGLKPAEAVCFQGTVQNFREGKGKFEFHINEIEEIEEIEANRNHRIEEQLRSKITSTMTVSTFLAGFTFAILNDLLKTGIKTGSFDCAQIVAAISMTLSLLFFIVSLYMYDNMAMPKEYWSYRHNGASLSPHYKVLNKCMRWTWNRVFTPGVIFFLIGFIAILFNTGFKTGNNVINGIIVAGNVINGIIFAGAGVVLIAFMITYYILKRLRLRDEDK